MHIWPTVAELAADLGKPYTTVAAWKQRGRIPPDHDAEIIAAAAKRGATLTFEQMARHRGQSGTDHQPAPTPSAEDAA